MSVLLSLSLSLGARCLRECGFSFCQGHGISLAGEKAAGAMGSWSCLCLGGDRSVYLARPDPFFVLKVCKPEAEVHTQQVWMYKLMTVLLRIFVYLLISDIVL